MPVKILNFTKHPIVIIKDDGTRITVPKTGTIRCSVIRNVETVMHTDRGYIPVNRIVYGPVIGLPEERIDTAIIVSNILAAAITEDRSDIYVVDEPVYDSNHKQMGCKSITRFLRDKRYVAAE